MWVSRVLVAYLELEVILCYFTVILAIIISVFFYSFLVSMRMVLDLFMDREVTYSSRFGLPSTGRFLVQLGCRTILLHICSRSVCCEYNKEVLYNLCT
jgi:hypothetical protein